MVLGFLICKKLLPVTGLCETEMGECEEAPGKGQGSRSRRA